MRGIVPEGTFMSHVGSVRLWASEDEKQQALAEELERERSRQRVVLRT